MEKEKLKLPSRRPILIFEIHLSQRYKDVEGGAVAKVIRLLCLNPRPEWWTYLKGLVIKAMSHVSES